MNSRAISTLEVMVVIAVLAVLAGTVVMPAYRNYAAARAPADAAATLAEDIALLERAAQNGISGEGASLVIVSEDPLAYRCYRVRPTSVDPDSALGSLIVERRFAGVALGGGPINETSPLLFAGNGSAQYVSGGTVANQHAIIEITLVQSPGTRSAHVDLNLFTGAVASP